MSTIQVRINPKEKVAVKQILDNIGLDFSSAVKLYFKQIQKYRGIPYLLTENGITPQQEDEILQAATDARKGVGLSKSMKAKDFVKHLRAL